MTGEAEKPLLPWTLSFLRPYQKRVALLAILLLAEIGLGALQPWPLEIIIDYVLQNNPFPAAIRQWIPAVQGADRFTPSSPSSLLESCSRSPINWSRPTGRRSRSIPASAWCTTCGGGCSST